MNVQTSQKVVDKRTNKLTNSQTNQTLYPCCACAHGVIKLQTYLGKPISVVGSIEVTVEYEGQSCNLPLIVVKGNGPTLLGTNGLNKMRLNWHSICYSQHADVSQVLEKYCEVFEDGLDTFKEHEAHLEMPNHVSTRLGQSPML